MEEDNDFTGWQLFLLIVSATVLLVCRANGPL
jgi:hypothetical protein